MCGIIRKTSLGGPDFPLQLLIHLIQSNYYSLAPSFPHQPVVCTDKQLLRVSNHWFKYGISYSRAYSSRTSVNDLDSSPGGSRSSLRINILTVRPIRSFCVFIWINYIYSKCNAQTKVERMFIHFCNKQLLSKYSYELLTSITVQIQFKF